MLGNTGVLPPLIPSTIDIVVLVRSDVGVSAAVFVGLIGSMMGIYTDF